MCEGDNYGGTGIEMIKISSELTSHSGFRQTFTAGISVLSEIKQEAWLQSQSQLHTNIYIHTALKAFTDICILRPFK